MKITSLLTAVIFSALAHLSSAEQPVDRVAAHEWGTFTSLQDEDGRAISGINTDDEPVPAFVHDIARLLLIPPTDAPPSFFQGAPSCHPDVTMRLETPVLYFHLPAASAFKLDVKVEFRGGWLTQFFPDATATAPGIERESQLFGHLKTQTAGRLEWKALTAGAGEIGPATDEHVWLAPRKVDAAMLKTANGECEKFLFYRGVAHRDAPFQVIRNRAARTLEILRAKTPDVDGRGIGKLWLVDIRTDGTAAFRTLKPEEMPADAKAPLAVTPATFEPSQYTGAAIGELRKELKTALVADGLFAGEAEALLETWELSYFKSAGMRLFFLVPPAWIERVLPLTISPAAEITRVMVGRIELVTPRQRELLAQIAAGPAPDPWKEVRQKIDALTWEAGKREEWNAIFSGKRTFKDVGFEAPAVYRAYLELGRFRNALVLDEEKHRPTPELRKFISGFALAGYEPVGP